MDPEKIGSLIRTLRTERHMTQAQLAQALCLSDKTISKWERGQGCPDVSLLLPLAQLFQVDMEGLLAGDLAQGDPQGGNMKKLRFYICPVCGNVVTAMAEATVSCCGKKLEPAEPVKAAPAEKLVVEKSDGDYFVTSDHPMTKEHHISFVALLTGDTLFLRKQYPEWGLQVRIPAFGHGTLVWGCSRDGVFYQYL